MNFRAVVQKKYDLLFNYLHQLRGYSKLHKRFLDIHGYPLDLSKPVTQNHRIVHKMLKDRSPLLTLTADKVKVRRYVLECLGKELADEILIPTYFESITGKDIPFQSWDFEVFVKANHFSGGNLLVKPGDDLEKITKLCAYWLNTSFGQREHEWLYRDIPRRIICEMVLRSSDGKIPMDIKFHCYHGKVKMIFFMEDRFEEPRRFYTDENLREMPGTPMMGAKKIKRMPFFSNLNEMKLIAEKLAAPFDFCRIDLYTIENQIYFGEITHYPARGLDPFDEYDADLTLGQMWKKENRERNFFQIYDQIKSNSYDIEN